MMQAFALAIDRARVGELAQHAVERRAVGILGAERARDLARADLAAAVADESDKLLSRGKAGAFHRPLMGRVLGRKAVAEELFGSLRGVAWRFSGARPFARPSAGLFACSFD